MGPNGSGKSTLANAIMGHPNLEVTEGQILFDGEDITEAEPDERARAGLFMAFQYPVAIPGVTVTKYLRMVMNAHREGRGEEAISLKDFRKTVEAAMELTQGAARVLQPLPQRRLLRRREEAHGDPPARADQADAGRARRDRLGPRHRRAEHRRRRRQHGRPGHRHGRADHHPLPAHPAHGQAAVRAHHVRGPDRQGGRPGARQRAREEGLRLDPRRGRRGGAPMSLAVPTSLRVPDPRAARAWSTSTPRPPSQTVRPALEAMDRYYETYRASDPPRRLPDRRGGDGRLRGRARARSPRSPARRRGETVFTRNATEAINLVAYAWGRANVGPDDLVVLTQMEHHSNIVPWQLLGCRLAYVPVSDDGLLDLDALDALLAQRPEARRGRPRLQRARHDQPDRRDRRARARRRRARAGRRRAGRAAAAGRRRRARRRLLRLDRPQGLRPDRASACCTAAASCSRRCRRSSAAGT